MLGMTVTRLRHEMPHSEYVAWEAFLAREEQIAAAEGR